LRSLGPALLFFVGIAQGQVDSCLIQTVAGSPTTLSPDGTPALQTRLPLVNGVAVDAAGSVYYSDTSNHRVRKIAADGSTVSVAGNGVPGFSGDGGPAIAAQLHSPGALAFDSQHNLYIADGANLRIRKVAPDGKIDTFAGNGGNGDGGDGGPAVQAGFRRITGLTAGPDDSLFVLDGLAGRVRNIRGGAIAAFAGNPAAAFEPPVDGQPALAAQLSGATAIAADRQGNLYIADGLLLRVGLDGAIRVLGGNGTTTGDGGPALTAQMDATNLAIDSAGNIYLYDANTGVRLPSTTNIITFASAIRMIDTAGTIHHIAGVSGVNALALAAQGVVAATNGKVQLVAANDSLTTLAGLPDLGFSGDGGPALSATMWGPQGLAFAPSGDLYFADSNNARVRRVDKDGVISTVVGTGVSGNGGDGGPAANAMLAVPLGIAIDRKGNLYVADELENTVRMVDTHGIISLYAGGGGNTVPLNTPVPATSVRLATPSQISVDSAGNLYILDRTHFLKKVSAADHTISPVPGGRGTLSPSSSNGFTGSDVTMTVDRNDNIYVLYTVNNGTKANISKITPAGQASTIDWIAQVPLDARSLAVDAAGNMYIGTAGAIHKYSPDGTLLTITGSYNSQDVLQDGPASQAAEGGTALSIGPDGNLYFADTAYSRIRRITVAGCATVRQPLIGGIVNAASLAGGYLAPGEIVSIFGLSIGPAASAGGAYDESGKLASSVSGVSVLVNGKPAPLYYVSSNQINVQVPPSAVKDLTLDMRVQYGGLTSDASSFTEQPASPGIFGSLDANRRSASLLNADGTINSASNPAVRGSVVSVFATGGGLTDPQDPDGVPAGGAAALVLPSAVSVNNVAADVLYAGAAPSFVGVVQVNFRVPDNPKTVSGYNTLLLSIGGQSNSDTSGFFVK
jgi:trimeric autotransporter adhesin